MRFVSEAIPQPDGTNLPNEAARKRYFLSVLKEDSSGNKRINPMTGEKAFKEYKTRKRPQAAVPPAIPKGGQPGQPMAPRVEQAEELPPGIDDLIQINVEHVDSRYSDNLQEFWLKARPREGTIKPSWQERLAPTGKGWVIEIRGYTFHNQASSFVFDTFAANLVRLGMPDVKPPHAGPGGPGGQNPVPGMPGPGTPGPGGKPGPGTPGPGTPGPGGVPDPGKKPAEPDNSKVPPEMRAVINNVSHVVLYKEKTLNRGDTGNFVLINNSVLDALVSGGAGAGQPGSPAAPPGMQMPTGKGLGGPRGGMLGSGGLTGASGRDTWKPISSVDSGASRQAGPFGFGQPGQKDPPPEPAVKDGGHLRTEFVILFVWKEPLSDLASKTPPPGTSLPGMSGGPPLGPGGPAMPPGAPGPGGAPRPMP